MGKSLVIVESPAKAKTINKYLGKDFIVKSSVGHIRDLPTSGSASSKSRMDPKERARLAAESRKLPPEEREKRKRERAKVAMIQRMGIDPEHNWKPTYEIMPGKEKVVAELQKLAKRRMPFTWPLTLIVKGKPLPGILPRQSAVKPPSTNALSLTK